MQTALLPGTDLTLSRVGLGCWTLSRLWWGEDHDDARAVRTIRAAEDAGINWVDTAPLYGHGHADRLVREALRDRPEVLVATKVGVRWDGEHATSDLSPAHVRADAEASLLRLGRDRLDLLQVHWPCEQGTPLEDTLGALVRLQEEGKVRAIGLCNYDAATLTRARALAPIASLQTPLSLLRREYEQELMGAVAGCGVLAYETLCRGLLTGRFPLPPSFPDSDLRSRDERFQGPRFAHAASLVADLSRVARKAGLSMPALAVGWVLQRPGVTAAIVGARTPDQIEQTALAAELSRKRKLWALVDRVAALHGGL